MKTGLRLVPKPAPPPAAAFPSSCRYVPLTEDLLRIVTACQSIPTAPTEAQMASVLARDHSFAIIDGGELVCALGVVLIHPGRAHGWLLKTPLARPRQMAYSVRRAREHFDRWQAEDPDYRRIEMTIKVGEPWRESFAWRLGMTCEGLMRCYDAQGCDHWLYARVA